MDFNFLLGVFIFLVAGCVVVPLAERFKLGSVLGFLIAGILIAPVITGIMGDSEQIMRFAEFGVIMMMFLIGMELEPAVLWRLRRSILGLGALQVILSSLVLMGIGIALGFSWQASLAVGMALAISSTALVMQMLREKNLTHTLVGETSFAVLLFQDMAVIPMLLIIPLLAAADVHAVASHSLIAHWPPWLQPFAVVGVIAGVILAGRYGSRHIFGVMARSNLREIFTAASLALVIGVTLLMELIGVSPTLGAFIAGVVLANSEYKRTIESDIEPFKGLLLGLFFISVGMGMNFNIVLEHPLTMAGAVIGLMVVKGAIVYVLAGRFGVKGPQGLGLAIGLAQGGEFAFVLLNLIERQFLIIDVETHRFLNLLVAISIGLTPILTGIFARFIIPRFMTRLPEQPYDTIEERNSVIIAGYGRFGQIVGRFMTYQGVPVTVLEKNPDQIELLRRFGSRGYFGDATRLDLLRSAGAGQAQLLIVAVDDAGAALDIVRLAKAHFPNLKVFARARNRRHAYELDRAGVDYYHREILGSSLALAREAMVSLGFNRAEMERKAQLFLAHDIATLKKSFEFFDSEPDLISYAKLSREELEVILREDKQDG